VDPARLGALDLNLLVVLDVLLAERSVTRAAARLGLSQPGVSNALARLRAALGDPLLVPTSRGMTPTPRAKGLESALRDAIDRLGGILGGASDFVPETSRRTFVLAATDYVQFVLLRHLAERVHAQAPSVVLRVVPTRAAPWQELEAGIVDLTITGIRSAPRGLHRRALFRDRVVCVVRDEHPILARPWSLARYLSLGHIEALPHGGEGGLADEVLGKLGHTRHLAVTVPQFLIAPHLVPHGDYCFTLADRIARPMAALLGLRVLPLPFDVPRITIWQYWHERVHNDEAHRWLRRLVADVADALDAPTEKRTRTGGSSRAS
jgi:DNA-binding transcriptional LysR family regulator